MMMEIIKIQHQVQESINIQHSSLAINRDDYQNKQPLIIIMMIIAINHHPKCNNQDADLNHFDGNIPKYNDQTSTTNVMIKKNTKYNDQKEYQI